MDFRLKVLLPFFANAQELGFNPCSNGLSAQRLAGNGCFRYRGGVSILVLMDFRLKGHKFNGHADR